MQSSQFSKRFSFPFSSMVLSLGDWSKKYDCINFKCRKWDFRKELKKLHYLTMCATLKFENFKQRVAAFPNRKISA